MKLYFGGYGRNPQGKMYAYYGGDIRSYNDNKKIYNDGSGYLNNSITSLGISRFIDEFQITRHNVGSYYKLGCGPLNEQVNLTDGTDNPLFQEGCN